MVEGRVNMPRLFSLKARASREIQKGAWLWAKLDLSDVTRQDRRLPVYDMIIQLPSYRVM